MEALKELVTNYIELTNQIKTMSKHIRESKQTLKSYEADILEFMSTEAIDELNAPNALLIKKTSKTMTGINKQVVEKNLLEALKDTEQVEKIMASILGDRKVNQKTVLKLAIPKE